MSVEREQEPNENATTPPVSSQPPMLRREAILVHQERARVATLVAVCSMLGVALGFALSTMAVAMRTGCPAEARVVRPLTVHSEQRPTWLGVNIVTAREYAGGGARVLRVHPGSPAQRVGLSPGDVVLKINGWPVETSNDLVALVRAHDPGQRVAVEVLRDGVVQTLAPALETMPRWAYRQLAGRY